MTCMGIRAEGWAIPSLGGKGEDMAEDRNSRKLSAGPGDTDTHSRWKVARRWSYGGLAFIAVVSLIGLIVAWSGHPSNNTLRYEFAKTCMQVLALTVFGGLATIATFNFQYSRTQEDNQLEQERRQLENGRDQRSREDDKLRSIAEETLDAYNRVKRIRRLLAAETSDGTLKLATYDRYMANLIDEQLTFERLKRLTPFIPDKRLRLPLDHGTNASQEPLTSQILADGYQEIEKFLNGVIAEYQERRQIIPEKTSASLANFDRLSAFVGNEFTIRMAVAMDKIFDYMLIVLWQSPE
jgi:hypothetical protein